METKSESKGEYSVGPQVNLKTYKGEKQSKTKTKINLHVYGRPTNRIAIRQSVQP